MREVGWHCDWSAGQKNSHSEFSYVFSLSLGDPRTVSYRRQKKNKGGSWNDCLPRDENTFHQRLEHGSLNILDYEDEVGTDGVRFQHRGALVKNQDTNVDGQGISVVLVCRTCPPENVVTVFGPKQKKPFYRVCTEEDKKEFNEREDGQPRRYNGTKSNVGNNDPCIGPYEHCHDLLHQHRHDIMMWVRNRLIYSIRGALTRSDVWSNTKKRELVEKE